MNFNYKLKPGQALNSVYKVRKNEKPQITIITAYYNGGTFIDETARSVLNQTYPFFEWLIVDDGTLRQEHIDKLKEIEQLDDRIKVFHKENSGLAATRDYGALHASPSSKYFLFLDDDDLLEPTYLECAYWTLETHPDAGWAYTDVVNFYSYDVIWNKQFNARQQKKENLLVATGLIRRSAFEAVNGYELREKSVHEDWNFWLKLMAAEYYPIHMNLLGFWYRRKENGENFAAQQNRKRALEIIHNTASTIKKDIVAIQYPDFRFNWEILKPGIPDFVLPKFVKNKKVHILMMVPWMTVGGADKFNLDLVKRIDHKRFDITVVITHPNLNVQRQEMEQYATVYDLTTFLDQSVWHNFIEYLIQSRNIDLIFNTNSTYGYNLLPYLKCRYPKIPILDYIHMEEWYDRNGGFSRDSSAVGAVIDKTLTCNHRSELVLRDFFGRDDKKLETVYIGIDHKEYDPLEFDERELEEIRLKYHISKKQKVISYVARIDYQKRPFLLVEIIRALVAERQDVVFLILGDGPLLTEIQKKVNSYHLDEYVRFTGVQSNPKNFYFISDLNLNCSIKEGLALTTYESLSLGIPVVSSDVGGQAEIINDEVGVIVPCLQKENEVYNTHYLEEEINAYVVAIQKILNDVDRYKEKARQRVLDGFTINDMIIRMEQIFTELTQQPAVEIPGMKDLEAFYLEHLSYYFKAYELEYRYLCKLFKQKYAMVNVKNREIQKVKFQTREPFYYTKKVLVKMHVYEEGVMLAHIGKDVKNLFVSLGRKGKNGFMRLIGRRKD